MSGAAVWKFGGTSVADAARISEVAGIVASADPLPVVVLSAPAGVTEALWDVAEEGAPSDPIRDRLIELAFEVGGEDLRGTIEALVDDRLGSIATETVPLTAAHRDQLLALGEDVSVRLLAHALGDAHVTAELLDARDIVRTDARFGAADPDTDAIGHEASARIPAALTAGRVPVLQGFIGSDGAGRTTTLGRGGSDLTATLLGSALESSAVHIWTDVDGILSGDPRWVDRPRSLDVVGFEEAVELAWFGARVLHAGAAKHAVAHRLPVRIRSTFAPERPGTLVLADRWGGPDIAAVACKRSVALIQVRSRPSAMEYGFLAGVFSRIAEHRTPVDLVATSHTSTSFTVDEATELQELADALNEVAEVEIRRGLSTVTVVGRGLLQEPGFAARVFQTVAFTPVHLISQATDSSLSFLVDDAEAEELVRRLHLVLIEGRTAREGTG